MSWSQWPLLSKQSPCLIGILGRHLHIIQALLYHQCLMDSKGTLRQIELHGILTESINMLSTHHSFHGQWHGISVDLKRGLQQTSYAKETPTIGIVHIPLTVSLHWMDIAPMIQMFNAATKTINQKLKFWMQWQLSSWEADFYRVYLFN